MSKALAETPYLQSAPTEQTKQASDTVKGWLVYGYATMDLGHGIQKTIQSWEMPRGATCMSLIWKCRNRGEGRSHKNHFSSVAAMPPIAFCPVLR